VVDPLNGWQRSPSQQLGHVFDLLVGLEHDNMVFGDHKMDVDHCNALLLPDLTLRVLDLEYLFLLLLTRENPAVVVFGVPRGHVVVQSQVEAPVHFGAGLGD
jgi:hypothetical protein